MSKTSKSIRPEPHQIPKPKRDPVAAVSVVAIISCLFAVAVASGQESQPQGAPVASERGPALVAALRNRYRAVTSLAIDLEITTLVHGHLMVDRGWIRFRTTASEIAVGGTTANPSLHRTRAGDRWRRDDGPWNTVPPTRSASLVSPLVPVFDALVIPSAVLVGTQERRSGEPNGVEPGARPDAAGGRDADVARGTNVAPGAGSPAPLVIEAPLRQGLGPFRAARLVVDEASLRLLAIELLSEHGDALLQCVLHSERQLDASEVMPCPLDAPARSAEGAEPTPSGLPARPRRAL